MARKSVTWKATSVSPEEILLDMRNPRIEVGETASQDEIRLKLLEHEDVLELAREIDKQGGLFYGERIITVVEDGQQVVLEGNRRVAACQMLLNSALVPSSYRLRFPKVSGHTADAIRKLSADVSPNREVAEPILTKRHTEQGAKPWTPVAKMRRAVRLLDQRSIPEVAELLGTTSTQVKKLIRPYRLLKYAIDIKGWNETERKILEDEKLKTNPYTRFFTLSKTKQTLQIHFDENENIVSSLPIKLFKEQMKRVVRDFLIPDPETKKTRCDTRTDPVLYWENFENDTDPTSALNQKVKPTATPTTKPADLAIASMQVAASGATRPKTPKASIFFENLECHVQDDKLIKLTSEIRLINHNRMTIAASLLTRALFECALVYKLQATKRWGELIKAEGKDPGLAEIIKFCSNFKNGIFVEQNICKTLQSHTTVQAKNYLDAITHLKYQEADPKTLESVANNIRQVIQYILKGN